MFTGIIEHIGVIQKADKKSGATRIRVGAGRLAKGLRINDSVAVNGVCLTVTRKSGAAFEAVIVEETMKKTTFSGLAKGDHVNLELPMKLNERLGGHLVLGHVDTVGEVRRIEARESSKVYTIVIPEAFARYLISVGSVSVDGVSLTVADLSESSFAVSIIPHTLQKTIFGSYAVGTKVNVEFDLIGKYIERMALVKSFPSEEELRNQGF